MPRETSSWDTSWRNPNAGSPNAGSLASAPISMGGLHFGSGPLATMPSVTTGFVSFWRPHTVGIGKKPDNPMDAKILEGGGGTFKGRIGGSSSGGTSGTSGSTIKPATQGSTTPNNLTDLSSGIRNWLGNDARVITNNSGDKIFLSNDGLRRVRFDINRTHPHNNPHGHFEHKIGNIWAPVDPDNPQIYPLDVPHN